MINKKIVINDIIVNYYIAKSSEELEPKVLFLHGWRADSSVWFKLQSTILKEGFNSISVDLPCFGQSQVPNKILDTYDFSDYIYEFISKLNLKNFILVGHSHGGAISTILAKKYPELFSKLILIDAAGIRVKSTKAKIIGTFSKFVKPIFKLKFMKGIRKRIYHKLGYEDYVESTHLVETYKKVIAQDLSSLYPQIKVPTEILWGKNDSATPLDLGNKIHVMIPNSKFTLFENSKHYPFLEEEDKFNDTFLNIIKN